MMSHAKMIEKAVLTIQSGNHEEGKRLLNVALTQPDLPSAARIIVLLWLAEVTTELEKKLIYYQEALTLAPENEVIKQRLALLSSPEGNLQGEILVDELDGEEVDEREDRKREESPVSKPPLPTNAPITLPEPSPTTQPSLGGKLSEVISDFIESIRPSPSTSAPESKPARDDDEFGVIKEEAPSTDAPKSPPPAADAPETPSETPDFDKMSLEDLMKWIESLAKRQGAYEGITPPADMDITEVDPNGVVIDEPGYVPLGEKEPKAQPAPSPQPPPPPSAPAPRPAPGAALPPAAALPLAARPPIKREQIPAAPPMAEEVEKAAPPKEIEVVDDGISDWLMESEPSPAPEFIEAEEVEEEVEEVASVAQPDTSAPVMFSAYPPKVAKKDEWQPLLAYVFRETAAQAVIADALKQLGEKQARFSQVTTLGKKVISEGAEIVARPTLAGFQFKPLEVKIGFYDDWQRFNFELRAKDAPLNKFATGNITFTVEGLIVADVPLSVYVGDESAAGEISSTVTRMYQAIFCSYSHDDTKIVERVERAYKALGLDYLRDITTLKSGTEWSEELLKLIDRADIFQLFWSQAAADSPYVKQEWQHALKLDHDSSNFIRPVYWQQPISHVPDALRHIHFAYQPDLDD